MAIEHDTDPNLPPQASTDPNYPASLGDRPSFGKLNYGPQMRAETDPNFLTPPATRAAKLSEAITEEELMPDDPVSDGPDSRGARRARHAVKAHPIRAGQNDTVKMIDAVQVNETVQLPDAMVAPEVIERRKRNQRKMRRDQMTELNIHGKKKIERKLLSAAIYGILAAAFVIAISEFLLK